MRSLIFAAILSTVGVTAPEAEAAEPREVGRFDNVPVGVAASRDGRVFVAFSRSIDPDVTWSVAELRDGRAVAFPPGFDQSFGAPSPDRLLAVQSVFVDAEDRLWILDSGKVGTNPVTPGSPKLIAWDLKTDREVLRVTFPADIAGPKSFLNDVRIDLPRNKAYLTDASGVRPALVVVDLATRTAERRLDGHPSVMPDRVITVDGQRLTVQLGPDRGKPFKVGADGLALSGDWVYFSALTSHGLHRVRAAELAKGEPRVEDLGDKGFAADGMLEDGRGGVYVTDFETHAIRHYSADGEWRVVMKDDRTQWPDTLALLPDGRLLFTDTQINRGALLRGKDERVRPFVLWSVTP